MNNNSIVMAILIAASIAGILGLAIADGSPLTLQKAMAEMCSVCIFPDEEGECFGNGC